MEDMCFSRERSLSKMTPRLRAESVGFDDGPSKSHRGGDDF